MDDAAAAEEIVEISRRFPRGGYRSIWNLLRQRAEYNVGYSYPSKEQTRRLLAVIRKEVDEAFQ